MSKRSLSNILVTGGLGFIGSNFIRNLFVDFPFQGKVINLDLATYAGNPSNLNDIANSFERRYHFVKGDIRDSALVSKILEENSIDTIVHFAAESHVDRSINGPQQFIETNINGTFNLLESARFYWKNRRDVLFHHISTDEVYGSLGPTGYFVESTPYDPRSPYSASKAASNHLVKAYFHTYDLPVTLSNCSNNYGPYQFPEKLIPLVISRALRGESLPVYGDGSQVRDWIHVFDHNTAVWSILKEGKLGESYNIGGENEWQNLRLVETLCEKIAKKIGIKDSDLKKLIAFVTDRPGHDKRYAIDCTKIKTELSWKRLYDFDKGLDHTVDWYLENKNWVKK